MRRPIDLGRRNPNCAAGWHGTEAAYRNGCRCPHAREASRLACARRRQGRAQSAYIDATGTARRIQALSRIGHRMGDIAQRLGTSYQFVQKLALCENPTISRRTAARVAAIYQDLAWKPGPSRLARLRAEAKGWASPVCWDDIDDPNCQPDVGGGDADKTINLVAVQLVAAGDAPFDELRTDAERVLAVGRLLAAGRSQTAICRELGIGHNRVRRLAALAGQQQAVAA